MKYLGLKHNFRRYGCVSARKYICQVKGCSLECGDQETLRRHMKREHPGIKLAIEETTSRGESIDRLPHAK